MLAHFPEYDMVVGARSNKDQATVFRAIGNRIYNRLASYVANFTIRDLTSGFRAMRAEVAKRFIYLLPNTFSYPTTLTLAFLRTGHGVKFEPIEAAPRVGKSKIKLLRDGSRFLLIIVRIATFFSPFKVFFPIALVSALLGIANYAYTFFASNVHQVVAASRQDVG